MTASLDELHKFQEKKIPLRKPYSLLFLSPPWERIEVRGNNLFTSFTLTLTLSPQGRGKSL
jgi:hypothetical protein